MAKLLRSWHLGALRVVLIVTIMLVSLCIFLIAFDYMLYRSECEPSDDEKLSSLMVPYNEVEDQGLRVGFAGSLSFPTRTWPYKKYLNLNLVDMRQIGRDTNTLVFEFSCGKLRLSRLNEPDASDNAWYLWYHFKPNSYLPLECGKINKLKLTCQSQQQQQQQSYDEKLQSATVNEQLKHSSPMDSRLFHTLCHLNYTSLACDETQPAGSILNIQKLLILELVRGSDEFRF